MDDRALTNDVIGELLWRRSDEESDHRRRALRQASRAARFWPEEAADLAAAGRSLTELRNVGPWVAERIQQMLDEPSPLLEPDDTRSGYLTMAQARPILDANPEWEATPHGDLHVHSTDSDGSLPLRDMAMAARDLGRTFMAATDHSESLKIAHGMDEERRRDQWRRIDELNAELEAQDDAFRVLRSIEMDVFVDGSADADPAMLAGLDLVLGAFHSKLRVTEDVTERYLAALRNPAVHVLAHPTARMYGRRRGLVADWPRVFEEAARLGKAVELDATPARQDLNVDLARVASPPACSGTRSAATRTARSSSSFLPFGMATAAAAGVPRERVLNYLPVDEVREWARALRERGEG